jgi:hypothetical protein
VSRDREQAPHAVIDVVEEPIRELAGLRAVDPPPALVARVMTRVADPSSPTFWQWLRRPFRVEIRLSPLGTLGLGLGLALGMALFVAPRSHDRGSSMLEVSANGVAAAGQQASAPVLVRFVLQARGARHVAVAGSFNDWNTSAVKLEDVNHDGVFVATVPLPPGLHQYMFVVDGEWVPDPSASELRPDGFGRQNSLLRI